MAYGDGDGVIFIRFTRSLDVVGHELTHGVVSHTSNLEYRNESGALNEHFADVFGSLVKQWKKKQTAAKADWLIGPDIMGPGTQAKSLRTFKEGKAYENDPNLGTDPQPKHLSGKYTGPVRLRRRAHQLGHSQPRVLPGGDSAGRQCLGEGGRYLVPDDAGAEPAQRLPADGRR